MSHSFKIYKETWPEMNKQFLIISMIVMISCASFSGCTTVSNEKNKFLGSWNGTYSWAGNLSRMVPATITFRSDGTYVATLPLMRDNGTWDIQDGKLTKTVDDNPAVVYSYSFTNNNTSLLLTSSVKNDQWNLTKQEWRLRIPQKKPMSPTNMLL